MATTYVSMANLTKYDGNLKTYIDSEKTKALKALAVKDNKINFYVNPAPADDTTPDFTVDFPTEYLLDQTKTTFVQEFAWSDTTYTGSTDPSLEGKPVLVLAVKGEEDEVTYSFVNLETLVDIYEGGETETATVTVDADTNEITVEVKVSEAEGNILEVKDDGLYASVTQVDISGKADKLVDPEDASTDPVIKEGQILVDDGAGNLAASGKTIAELSSEILAELTPMTDEEIDNLFA